MSHGRAREHERPRAFVFKLVEGFQKVRKERPRAFETKPRPGVLSMVVMRPSTGRSISLLALSSSMASKV